MAYQTRDVLATMQEDAGVHLTGLNVDGGASGNHLLMQFQADLLGVPVRRPIIAETTALGAAYLAGLAVGYWQDTADLSRHWTLDREYRPALTAAQRGPRGPVAEGRGACVGLGVIDTRRNRTGNWTNAIRWAPSPFFAAPGSCGDSRSFWHVYEGELTKRHADPLHGRYCG